MPSYRISEVCDFLARTFDGRTVLSSTLWAACTPANPGYPLVYRPDGLDWKKIMTELKARGAIKRRWLICWKVTNV